ncbi:MAG: TIGR04283 family arsenosugar biosynthesis glycosyltransferase [Pseudomonadota bacterium]
MKQIGVVIPSLNERDYIVGTINSVYENGISEIVVSDGGSTDGTVDCLSRFPNLRLVHSPRGRGYQINVGIELLRSEFVIVLHADTRLPQGADDQIRGALADPAVACGCFRLNFDEQRELLKFSAWISRYESYWTTFGDQAFFFRRSDFKRIGGAPDWPLFEDVELRQRFRTVGDFKKMQSCITTSARRFRSHGPVRTQFLNTVLLTGFALGISPERLSGFYRR